MFSIQPMVKFDALKVADLRHVHVSWTTEQIDGYANVIFDDTTTFVDDEFRQRLINSGAFDLSDKETLKGATVKGADFRAMDFAGYDLFDTTFEKCKFDSLTSFKGAYVCNTVVPEYIDLAGQGAIIFEKGSKSLKGKIITADLDMSRVESLHGSSLLGTDMSLSDARSTVMREKVRSKIDTDLYSCLFDDMTKFPSTLRDEFGDVENFGCTVASCDFDASSSSIIIKAICGSQASHVAAKKVRDMPLKLDADIVVQRPTAVSTFSTLQTTSVEVLTNTTISFKAALPSGQTMVTGTIVAITGSQLLEGKNGKLRHCRKMESLLRSVQMLASRPERS